MNSHILIPVKSLNRGKSRLDEVLDLEQRRGLIRAMLMDVLAAINQSRTAFTSWVLTSENELTPIIRTYHARQMEDQGDSLNSALKLGVSKIQAVGGESLLIIPCDVPLLQPDDLDQLNQLALGVSPPALFITPSYTGGTNLLYETPVDLITPSFGSDSFQRHYELSVRKGCAPHTYLAPTIRLDIDVPEDLQRFLATRLALRTHTHQFLQSIEIEALLLHKRD